MLLFLRYCDALAYGVWCTVVLYLMVCGRQWRSSSACMDGVAAVSRDHAQIARVRALGDQPDVNERSRPVTHIRQLLTPRVSYAQVNIFICT